MQIPAVTKITEAFNQRKSVILNAIKYDLDLEQLKILRL
jgi:hypothetical protein